MSGSAFRAAVEAKDLDGMMALFAPDAVLHSPVTFKPFEGVDAIRMLFGVLIEVFQDFTYIGQMAGEGVESLLFTTRVGTRDVEGIDIIRTDDAGRIVDFTVMVRPMSAVHALAEQVGARLLGSAT